MLIQFLSDSEMPEKNQIENPSAPSREVQSLLIKLWDLIYELVEHNKSLKSQKSDLDENFRKIVQGIDRERGVSRDLKNKNVILEERHEQNNSRILELDRKNGELKEIITKRDSEISELKTLLDQSKEENVRLLANVRELSKTPGELDKLKESFEFAQKEIARKNHEIHGLNDKIYELKEQISALDNQSRDAENLRNEIEQINSVNDDLEKRIIQLTDSVNDRKEKLRNADIAAAEEKRFAAEANKKLQEKQKAYGLLKEEKAAIEKELNEARTINKNLNDELNRRILEGKSNAEDLAKIKELKESVQEKNEKINSLEKQIDDMKNSIANSEKKIGSLQEQLEKPSEADETDRLKETMNQLLVKEHIIEETQARIADLESSLWDLREENERLKETAGEAEQLRNRLEADRKILDESQQQVKALNNQLMILENKRKHSDEIILEKEDIIKALKEEQLKDREALAKASADEATLNRLRQKVGELEYEAEEALEYKLFSGESGDNAESPGQTTQEIEEKEKRIHDLEGLLDQTEKSLNIKSDQIKKLQMELEDNIEKKQLYDEKKIILIKRVQRCIEILDRAIPVE